MSEPKGHPVERKVWEEQYKAGRWQYLSKIEEMGRYGVISAYLHRDAERLRVLDVGGGEGILYHYLDSSRLDRYVSLDLAESAFESTKVPADRGTFIAGDMETYEFGPEDRFNAVVFNEVLYFASEPMKVLDRMAALIEPSGIIVISMWHAPDTGSPFRRVCDSIWRAIDQSHWKVLDDSAVTNIPANRSWRVRALSVGG